MFGTLQPTFEPLPHEKKPKERVKPSHRFQYNDEVPEIVENLASEM